MNGRETNTEQTCSVPTGRGGGLVIQASVNWREGLDNRISSGNLMANFGFCKSLFKVNIWGKQHAAKWGH